MLEKDTDSGKRTKALALIGLLLASTVIVGQNLGSKAEAAFENVVASKSFSQSGTIVIQAVELTAEKSSRASGTITVAIAQGSSVLGTGTISTSKLGTSLKTVPVAFSGVQVTGSFEVVVMYLGSGRVTVTNIAVPGMSAAPPPASDTAPPSVAITSPSGGSTVPAGSLTVGGAASDAGSGISTVQVRVGSGSYVTANPRAAGDWSTWTVNVNIGTGQNTITARATDNAGNQAAGLITVTASSPQTTVDTTPPSVAITTPAENSVVTLAGNSVVVTGTAGDSGSGIEIVEVRVDSDSYFAATPKAAGDWSTWSVTLPITVGERRLVPRATDNAGNHAWNSIYVTFAAPSLEDTTGPSVAITSPAEGATVTLTGSTITILGTASDSGSGMSNVEVRIDDGSYSQATPRAPGDWSTWSITLPITAGERRIVPRATDNAGNSAWNSISVTVDNQPLGGGSGNTLDGFGIKKIYPTRSGGNEWHVDMDDPDSDSLFRNLPSMTRQSDGSWQVNGGSRGQVRMEAWSPANEKWLNVEITMYAKIVGGSNELLQLYSRGGHHTSSNECLGSAYKARLYGDGEARWVKEVTHPAYTSNRGSMQATNEPLEDRWVGFKAVIYNFVDNGRTYVRMESYIDDDVTDSRGNLVIDNDWQLASVVEDRGGWSTGSSSFDSSCGRDRDEILTQPGGTSTQNIAAFRSDDLTWNFKYLSVREIVPPS